jgi:sphingomyelin phosphodiesterase acid-like 3
MLLLLLACTPEPIVEPPPEKVEPALVALPPELTLSGPYYLHLSDVHLDTTGKSSDTDSALWAQTKARLAGVVGSANPPRFVVYTGDLPGHYTCADDTCLLTPEQAPTHAADVTTVLSDLAAIAGKIPVLYAPGNNDSLAGDYYSFADATKKTPTALVPGYPALNTAPTCDAGPPCMVSNPAPEVGYYSARPVEGLRVIALNSVVFGNTYRPADGLSQLDAGNAQVAWLRAQLTDLGTDKALIILHIPPGKDAYAVSDNKTPNSMWARLPTPDNAWLDQVVDLLGEYSGSVVGLAYGHTHMEELRRTYNRGAQITEVAVGAPGITTNHGNNPGFKMVSYDSNSKELTDWVTLWTTVGAPSWGADGYRFSLAYDCPDTTILDCMKKPAYADSAAIDVVMRTYYRLGAGDPTYTTVSGIDVTVGQ